MSDAISDLLDADERCLYEADVLFDAFDGLPTPVAMERFQATLALARGEARRAADAPSILIDHLSACWNALEVIARHRGEWPAVPTHDVVDALGGSDAASALERVVAEADHESVWRYMAARSTTRRGLVPIDTPGARAALERTLADAAQRFRRWLVAREGATPGLDADVVLGPGTDENSWYDPHEHRVVIGPAELMLDDASGSLRVDPTIALRSLAHELAGHAVQNALSSDLPACLQPDDRARLRPACLPAAEGFAIHRAALSVRFAEECAGELDLSDFDVELLRAMVELTPMHYAVTAFVGLLDRETRRVAGFDAVAEAERIVRHRGFGERLAHAEPQPLHRLIYNASCVLGARAYDAAAERLELEGRERADVLRRLGRGAWALSVLDDAIEAEP